MWFVKQLQVWRDLREISKLRLSAEFMDNIESQMPLSDMYVNMQAIVILYWLSISNVSEKLVKLRLDFLQQRQTVDLCIGKSLQRFYVEYAHHVPYSARNQLKAWPVNLKCVNLMMKIIKQRMHGASMMANHDRSHENCVHKRQRRNTR